MEAEISTGKPYKDFPLEEHRFMRKFFESVDSDELIWHKDKKNRTIKVLEGTDWMLQYDDKLPFVLEQNEVYTIEAETYHRIIKGNGTLILEIEED